MKIDISQKTEQPLLNRTTVHGKITFEGATPSNKDVGEALGKQLNHDAKLVLVKQMMMHFGKTQADLHACLYKDKESLSKVEGIEIKEEPKPDAKEGDKPAEGEAKADGATKEAKSEEKPKEDAKPEAKEEPKTEEKKE